jgi:hypothetical protein
MCKDSFGLPVRCYSRSLSYDLDPSEAASETVRDQDVLFEATCPSELAAFDE